MNDSDFAKVVGELPILPKVLLDLMHLSSDDKHYFSKIEDIAERDPPLAIKVLHMSNSAKHSTVSPVTSIHKAVVRLGTEELFNMTALVAVTRVFVPSNDAEKRLWLHSIQVAEILKLTFEVLGEIAISRSTAYLVGLLHDIGLFVRFHESQEDYNKIEELDWTTPEEHIKIEMKTLRQNHAYLGGKVCKHWGVPLPVPQIIHFHHHYSIPPKYAKYKPIIEVVRRLQFADIVSEMTRLGEKYSDETLNNILDKNKVMMAWVSEHQEMERIVNAIPECLDIANQKYQALEL